MENQTAVAAYSAPALRRPTMQTPMWQMLKEQSKAIARSGLFGAKTEDTVITIMLLADALGIHPVAGLNNIYIVNGKPSPSVHLMMALVQDSGLLEDYQYDDNGDTATVSVKRKGLPAVFKASFSNADAERAGLNKKDTWRNFPRDMRRARATSTALRMGFSDVILGLYSREEMEDAEYMDRQPAPGVVAVRQPVEVIEPETEAEPAVPAQPEDPQHVAIKAWAKAKMEKYNQTSALFLAEALKVDRLTSFGDWTDPATIIRADEMVVVYFETPATPSHAEPEAQPEPLPPATAPDLPEPPDFTDDDTAPIELPAAPESKRFTMADFNQVATYAEKNFYMRREEVAAALGLNADVIDGTHVKARVAEVAKWIGTVDGAIAHIRDGRNEARKQQAEAMESADE